MDWRWAGLLLFREPSPSLCGGWTGHWARHEEKTEDTEANEGTSLDIDGSSSSVPFPWSRFYLQSAANTPSSPVPAAHIICYATVHDIGLLTAARPPPDRPCLSPKILLLSRTPQMPTLPWNKDESCVLLPSLKTGPIPEHTVSPPCIPALHRDNSCRVLSLEPTVSYVRQSIKSGWWLIKVLDAHLTWVFLFSNGQKTPHLFTL